MHRFRTARQRGRHEKMVQERLGGLQQCEGEPLGSGPAAQFARNGSKKADDAEYDISKLKNEIDDLEKEQAEIEEKIDKFARQTRLFD